MAKYIDAEKLKAEIERLKEPYHPYLSDFENGCREGRNNALDDIFSFINSLQQEFPTTDEKVKEFLAIHPKIEVPEKYKNPDWLFKEQKQSEVDLEKEIKNKKTILLDLFGPMNGEQSLAIRNFARYFYELGRKGGNK